MKSIGLAYATREGQTRKIVRHLAESLSAQGFAVEVWNVPSIPPAQHLDTYDALILAASVHCGGHEPEMVTFVRQHLDELQTMPAAFLSVSLSQAGVERPGTTADEHARFSASVQEVLNRFFRETNWYPKHFKAVAGALLYTRYNFLIRFVMKQISKKAGGSTDTTQDHEYTDWASLDRFVAEFTGQLSSPKALRLPA
jgi:menaquinone-dependent protoporphyrinogen oxidase